MDELAALLADDPAASPTLEATPGSYRRAPPGGGRDHAPPIDHVKLFQPVHGHFNLVAATLVCRVAGLPDKASTPAAEEIAAFVLRRVARRDRSSRGRRTDGWRRRGRTRLARRRAAGPDVPVPYTVGGPRPRGFRRARARPRAPSSSKSAGAVSMLAGARRPSRASRPTTGSRSLDAKVLDPLRTMTNPSSGSSDGATRAARQAAQRRGLAVRAARPRDLLARHAPALWTAVQAAAAAGRRRPARSAYDLLRDTHRRLGSGPAWREALARRVGRARADLGRDRARAQRTTSTWATADRRPDELRTRIVSRAAGAHCRAGRHGEPAAVRGRRSSTRGPATRYVVRCVYRRPHCGPLHPDARQRAVRAVRDRLLLRPRRAGPPDPHRAADRHLDRRPAQGAQERQLHDLARAARSRWSASTDLKKVLDGQLATAEPLDLGLICSFSIPIITICALIVLMIFVVLLNIVFWWLPFFRICFPIPLKATE